RREVPKMVPFCLHQKRCRLHRIAPMRRETRRPLSPQLRHGVRLAVPVCTKLHQIASNARAKKAEAPPGFEPGMADLQSAEACSNSLEKPPVTDRFVPGSYTLAEKSLSGKAITDLNLSRVIEAWPALPEPIRRAVLALITSGTDSSENG